MKIRTGFVSNSSSSSFICKNYSDEPSITIAETKKFMKALVKFSKGIGIGFEESDYEVTICSKEWEKDLLKHWQCLEIEGCTGNVVINSTNDNSIPCSLFELIKNRLGCFRVHLG